MAKFIKKCSPGVSPELERGDSSEGLPHGPEVVTSTPFYYSGGGILGGLNGGVKIKSSHITPLIHPRYPLNIPSGGGTSLHKSPPGNGGIQIL